MQFLTVFIILLLFAFSISSLLLLTSTLKTGKKNAKSIQENSKIIQQVRSPLSSSSSSTTTESDNTPPPEIKSKRQRPKLFHYAPVSEKGTMRYQLDKGPEAEWFEQSGCKLISAESPRVITCDHFLQDAECEELISLGEPLLQKSGVVAPGKTKNIRTSFGGRLPSSNSLVKKIDRKILSMLGFNGKFAERLYLLRYEKGQKYVEHTDGFGGITGQIYSQARRDRYTKWMKKSKNIDVIFSKENDDWKFENITDGRAYTLTDRAATILIYLRTMPQGGGGNTSFPLLDRFGNVLSKESLRLIRRKNLNNDRQKKKKKEKEKDNDGDEEEETIPVEHSCDPNDHLTIAPEAGKLLIFYDMKEDGSFEPKSSHAGCSVLGDVPKYTVTKWLQIPLP
jgi:hypothetical protein